MDDLVVENSTDGGMTILTPDASKSTYGFGSHTEDMGAWIEWGYNDGLLGIKTNKTGASIGFFTNTYDEAMRIDSAGAVYIGETTNAKMTVGLTINQGANDNEAFALKSSVDVCHIMTNNAEDDTYFTVGKYSGLGGGAWLQGFADIHASANHAMTIQGNQGEAADTTDNTSGHGVVVIAATVTNGTSGLQQLENNGNLLTIENYTTTRFLVKGDGALHATVISPGAGDLDGTALDAEDDVGLLRTFERNLHNDVGISMTKWDDQIKANEDDLKRVGVLSSEGHFYNMQRMNSLLGGGIWQIHCRQQNLEEVVDYQQEEIESLKKELRLLKG
jgi:hypothetical protein